MKHFTLGSALALVGVLQGLVFSQVTIPSKLNGKNIYVYRQDAGDHTEGYNGLVTQMNNNRTAYGYTFANASGLNVTQLNALYNRLYKGPSVPKTDSTIDILILVQGQGDRNVGGGSGASPFAGAPARFGMVRDHIKSGGGFVIIHAAAGREVSWQGWRFGAALMTDWFVDNYRASVAVPGGDGHFSANTSATVVLDQETVTDPSIRFIRKIMTAPADSGGYAKLDSVTNAFCECYHFNGGFRNEDGTGGAAALSSNTVVPKRVRGDPGVPDSGIGPAKMIAKLTRISTSNYIPPAPGRPAIWGREVSAGAFDSTASATNGRFLFISLGHQANEYTTYGSGWLREMLFSGLRWVSKEDRGCTNPAQSTYNPMATVDDGSCPVGINRDVTLQSGGVLAGRISVEPSTILVSMQRDDLHAIQITSVDGKTVFRKQGSGRQEYRVSGLQSGFYTVRVNVGGQSHQQKVFLLR